MIFSSTVLQPFVNGRSSTSFEQRRLRVGPGARGGPHPSRPLGLVQRPGSAVHTALSPVAQGLDAR